jgi:hypothetical protein
MIAAFSISGIGDFKRIELPSSLTDESSHKDSAVSYSTSNFQANFWLKFFKQLLQKYLGSWTNNWYISLLAIGS